MIDLSVYLLGRWNYARTSDGGSSLVICSPQLDSHRSNIGLHTHGGPDALKIALYVRDFFLFFFIYFLSWLP